MVQPLVPKRVRDEVERYLRCGDASVTALLTRVLRQARRDWQAADAAWAEDEYEGLQVEALQRRWRIGSGR